MNAPRWEPDPHEIAAWVEDSCRAQGLVAKVQDNATLDESAFLLNTCSVTDDAEATRLLVEE